AAIGHGYTYSGHPVGAAAAIACVTETLRLNVKDNAAARGQQLFEGLQKLYDDFDVIGDVRGGHGLMCALELVSDRTTKKPIDKATPVKLQKAAYESGAMIRVSGPNVILSPPLVLTAKDVDTILAALRTGFQSL
ncbi:MAG: aminotransferase class III-fold pyridoxal phosphate-dependent enzyme, partial [Paracoccaceae bacterium]